MNHYKSWSGLNKQLSDFLCDPLKERITYFLTRYHKVHDSYGRAAIRLDGNELVCFSWIEMYRQETDVNELWEETGIYDPDNIELKAKWAQDCAYCDMDFLSSALSFINMPIKDAIDNQDHIIKILAIMDRRLGKRTLRKIYMEKQFEEFPQWVRQFYELRFAAENIGTFKA